MRKLIRTDGTEQEFDKPLTGAQVRELIGAEVVDTVALRHLGYPLHVMTVDDHGYETATIDHGGGHFELKPTKARKPLNEKATALYLANCRLGTTHRIVGDVFVQPDDDYA